MTVKTTHIILTLIAIYCCNKNAFTQQHQDGKFGVSIGVVIALGTHVNRFGTTINSYYINDGVQVNSELRLYFNSKNLGPTIPSVEGVASLGLVYAYGKKDTSLNKFYSPVSNQTHRNNSLAYAYRYYFNNIATNQPTGTISIQVGKYNFITENDVFAQPKLDRYRTGAFLFQYQKDDYLIGLNSTLFTGEMGERITDESYPFNHVYENTVGGKYTQFSHGLLSAQFKYAGDYYQTYQANLGLDGERIRHAIQNRFVHDILVMPKLTGNIDAHIPMLDDKGEQYLFKEGQKVKPMKFYFNGFTNPAIFY